MSLLAVKLGRDLRATWPRLALMVVAIAVSLTAFGAVLASWNTVTRETERAYLSTEPASATILLGQPLDAARITELAAAARTRPGVREATGRGQFTSEVAVDGEPRELPLQVFVAAPSDPLRMARFFPRQGSWPPAAGTIYIGQDSLRLLGVALGETVTIETPDGTRTPLRVAGSVYDPGLSPAGQEQTARGYLATDAAVFDQLKIQVGDRSAIRDRDAIVAVASEIGEWLGRERGLAVREIQVPTPYAHPHQGQADALLTALLAGAGAALLLSTILVATMLNGLFTRQIPQIGIMKAIGARSVRIGRLYLVMTLLVAGAATALAFPLGILLSRVFIPNVFGFLGIESASLAADWWTYPVVLAAGLLLPVLLALVPLVRTARTTVRAAIDHHGGTSHQGGVVGLVARLSRLRWFDRGLLMALRNTVRRPARFLLSVGLLACAGMTFVAGLSARDGMAAVGEASNERLRWDVTVQLTGPANVDALDQIPHVRRVEGWTLTSASLSGPGELPVTRTYPDQGHGRLTVTAIPAGTTMFTRPALREGRWLEPRETGAVVLNQVTLANADPEIRPGDAVDLTVNGRTARWRVVGIAEEPGATSLAYVTTEGLARAAGESAWPNTLRVATDRHDETTRESVAAAVAAALTDAGVEVGSSESVSRHETVTGGHLEPILVILLATALPMGVIGCIGLASTMGASVLERIRELGVMHAIGASPKAVRRIVVAEGLFIALASCLLAVIPALGLTAALGALLGNTFMAAPLPFRFSALASVVWIALVVLGAWLATEAAATRASRLTVREALAYL